MPGGRPTKYRSDYHPEHAYNYCLLGATDVQLATFFDVDPATLYRWKRQYPEFANALWRGKVTADANVAAALYRRAVGYEQEGEKIFCMRDGKIFRAKTKIHLPPHVAACIFWLKNRQPQHWGNRRETTHLGQDPTEVAHSANPFVVYVVRNPSPAADPPSAPEHLEAVRARRRL